jgi:CBS domain
VRVREVMSSPVVCVPPDTGIKEVADLLVRDGISAVPVELAPDPRAHLIPPAEPPAHLPKLAAEVMTRAVVALPEEADIAEAGRLLLERRIKSVPILRGRPDGGHRGPPGPAGSAGRSDQDIARELEGCWGPSWERPARTGRQCARGASCCAGPATRPTASTSPG